MFNCLNFTIALPANRLSERFHQTHRTVLKPAQEHKVEMAVWIVDAAVFFGGERRPDSICSRSSFNLFFRMLSGSQFLKLKNRP